MIFLCPTKRYLNKWGDETVKEDVFEGVALDGVGQDAQDPHQAHFVFGSRHLHNDKYAVI